MTSPGSYAPSPPAPLLPDGGLPAIRPDGTRLFLFSGKAPALDGAALRHAPRSATPGPTPGPVSGTVGREGSGGART